MSADGDMVRTTESVLAELTEKVNHIIESECDDYPDCGKEHTLDSLPHLFAVAANDIQEANRARNRWLWGI